MTVDRTIRDKKVSKLRVSKKGETSANKERKPVIYQTREEIREYNHDQQNIPQKKEGEGIDYMKVITLKTNVDHKKFGDGQVTMIDSKNKRVSVRFKTGEKTFVFPEAFENGFLNIV